MCTTQGAKDTPRASRESFQALAEDSNYLAIVLNAYERHHLQFAHACDRKAATVSLGLST